MRAPLDVLTFFPVRRHGTDDFITRLKHSLSAPHEPIVLDLISKSACIVGHAFITGDEKHQRRRVAEKFGGRDVYCIKRANWFDGKWPADSLKDLFGYGNNLAAAGESLDSTHGGALTGGVDAAGRAGYSATEWSVYRRGRRERRGTL